MAQLISLIIVVGSCFMPFYFKPLWAWLPITILGIYLTATLIVGKNQHRYETVSHLSNEAQWLLNNYALFFSMPFASKDYSAASATCQFGGIVLAIICVIKGFWWAIPLGIINWIVMSYMACSFSPTAILAQNPSLREAYDEVVLYVKQKS